MAQSLLNFIDASAVATMVRDSEALIASLSALHAIGYTVVMGGAILSGMRLTGARFRERPAGEILRPAGRAVAIGLLLSGATGALLFASRAVSAGNDPRFQLKMVLLVAAVSWQLALFRRAVRVDAPPASPLSGALGLSLWIWLALTACAFILLE